MLFKKKKKNEQRGKKKNDIELDFFNCFFFFAGSNTGSSPVFNIPSATPARKAVGDDFLNSDNDKNDYDW